ncbi:MAG: Gfo/Idh/MocA family protein [Candidatus Puniceispirillaceae bacterium]
MTTYYGMIGCGMMGQEHLRNIALLDDTNVSVIYEPEEAMAQSAAALAPDATFVPSIDALLAHPKLDCIVIVSPNFCHASQLQQIASQVTLPILVEKPLFTNPDDLDDMLAFRDSYQAPVWVAMEYRYMPPMQQFLNEAESFTGGIKMLSIIEHRFPFLVKVGNWNRFNENSGGTFVEKCCHFFDLMRLIIGADPVRIMASAGQDVNHLDETYDGKPSDILDCGYVIVDFANGKRAMLELSMFAEGSEFQEMVHAIGPNGKLEVKLPGPARLWSGPADKQPIPQIIKSPRQSCDPQIIPCPIDKDILDAGDHNGSTFYQHQRFLDVVRGTGQVEVSLDDGIWAVRMGMAAQESAKTGQAVIVTPHSTS